MRRGLVPEDMHDRWFIFFEEGWLHFHRSWTGYWIFSIQMNAADSDVHITEGWASRDAEQYRSCGDQEDVRLISGLIQGHLL